MSHKLLRIPRRLRRIAKREVLFWKCICLKYTQIEGQAPKEPKKKTRKHKRRPGYILRDYIRRQKKFVWLQTHIWHAKRFHMTNLWGYKIVDKMCVVQSF